VTHSSLLQFQQVFGGDVAVVSPVLRYHAQLRQIMFGEAEYLENHPNVEKTYYPGLRTHPQHSLAKRQMKGFGGVVSFELKGDLSRTMRFVDSLKLALIGASLGGTETLVSQPSTASHFFMDPVERRKAGISDSLVRLSLGIEDADDIISDLAQALEA
jgi:cystathionine beta-lyase/cystathionine gamma-synthase